MTNEEIIADIFHHVFDGKGFEKQILKALKIARLEGQIEGIYCLDGDIPPSFLLKKCQQEIKKLLSE